MKEIAHAKLKITAKNERRSLNVQLEYYSIKCIESYESEHGKMIVNIEEHYGK